MRQTIRFAALEGHRAFQGLVVLFSRRPGPYYSVYDHQQAGQNYKCIDYVQKARTEIGNLASPDACKGDPGANERKTGPGTGVNGAVTCRYGALRGEKVPLVCELRARLVVV